MASIFIPSPFPSQNVVFLQICRYLSLRKDSSTPIDFKRISNGLCHGISLFFTATMFLYGEKGLSTFCQKIQKISSIPIGKESLSDRVFQAVQSIFALPLTPDQQELESFCSNILFLQDPDFYNTQSNPAQTIRVIADLPNLHRQFCLSFYCNKYNYAVLENSLQNLFAERTPKSILISSRQHLMNLFFDSKRVIFYESNALHTPIIFDDPENHIKEISKNIMKIFISTEGDNFTLCIEILCNETMPNNFAFERQMHSLIPAFSSEITRQASIFSPLCHAIKKRDLNLLRILLDKGYPINTAIHWAVHSGFIEIAEELISKGADVNIKDSSGNSPLHLAAYLGKFKLAQLLMTNGANVGSKNNHGVTPLHAAANMGCFKIVSGLLARGAPVNDQDQDGYTALHHASIRGYFKIAQFLIQNQASVLQTKLGISAIHLAAFYGHLHIINLLAFYRASIDVATAWGYTALHAAAREGRLDIVYFLLSQGADVNRISINGETPLHLAAATGNFFLVQLLVAKGALTNIYNKNWQLPVHIALQKGYMNIACFLDAMTPKLILIRHVVPIHPPFYTANTVNALTAFPLA